ncbi:hypothetical protein [Leucobacter chromiiresistens]|uniref:GAF domain-containing protein n=1 Tax=Leucobacter chromiiresistens TaxID=1079994 RepID=A0A1H0ZLL1_9MICO|nr:hypothetical protein [Leucobacter chromiiresistens]SDQ28264.1 hypothetical protein SAMN04488565_1872 [Leucobacter chromiiresistens]
MTNGWNALRRGESALERRRLIERAHERFVDDGASLGAVDPEFRERFSRVSAVRPVVLDSWLRAHRLTVDPDGIPERPSLGEDELREVLATHPIGSVLPVVSRLLLDEADESGFIVAVGDAAGRLLWVDGDRALRGRAEEMGFRAGMDWSERAVGTSAPGSALALDHALQVLGAEHFARAVHPWSCTAAPVHDPASGAIIGVIDVTGGDGAAAPHLMPLMEATLAAVEAELQLAALRQRIERDRGARARAAGAVRAADAAAGAGSRRPAPRPAVPRLVVLGRDPAVLEHGGVAEPVGRRHAEILMALAASPHGLSAGALAEAVYGARGSERTLRPEMVRLRRWLDERGVALELLSRPYRIAPGLRIDAHETLEAVERGAHRLALAAYEGPVLPDSRAPIVEQLRATVDATLREAMLQAAGPDPLFAYAQNWASDDVEVWETLLQVLPPLSPKRARVVARLEQLSDT